MPAHRSSWVYILASQRNGTLYVGVTNDLHRRMWQHKNGASQGFTHHYAVDRLAYYEVFHDIRRAIAREKQIKGWKRQRKLELIERMNPHWFDLSAGWFDERLDSSLRSE